MNWIRKTLFTLHVIVGIGGLAGGYGCLSDIYNPLGAPLSLLENSPFTSYFFPGLFLLFIIGLGNIVCSILVLRYPIVGMMGSLALGIALSAWIVIQCIILQDIVALHIIFLVVGLVQTGLSLWQLIQSGDLAYLLRELIN
ncbi:MAG: hypothetical protein GX626_04110 [Spirochaetales bacterium]|jgi:hypothetical protein|nr:hypothetical protein [Spirochaetales bacterium]